METASVAKVVENAASEAPGAVRVAQISVLDEQSGVRVAQIAASEAPSVVMVD